MSSQHPRTTEDWVRTVERKLSENRRAIGSIKDAVVQPIVDAVEADRTLVPTAPIELVWQTGLYLDLAGRGKVRFILDFPDVVKSTTAKDITATQYELWGFDDTVPLFTDTTSAWPGVMGAGSSFPGGVVEGVPRSPAKAPRLLATSSTSSFRVDGFTPGTIWKFQVRALGLGLVTPGQFSIQITVPMAADATPPEMPTAPKVTAARGTLTVEWDGKAVTGPMPADFKYAVLAWGDASSPTTEVARFGRDGGRFIATGMDYYDVQFFRLQAVDETGNRSPWSEQGVGYTTPLVDRDIILSEIDGAETYLHNINAGVAILDDTILARHLVATEDLTAKFAQFLEVNADMINVNSLAADEIFVGLMDAVLVVSDMFVGKEFQGGTFTGTKFQTDAVEYDGIKIDPSGILAYGASGIETFRLDAATGDLTASSGTLTGLTYQSHLAANTGIKLSTSGLKFYDSANRLAVDVSLTSATFTGTIKSGFGTTSAVLTDNAGRGRPGLMLPVNTTSYWQPQILAAGGLDGWAAGTLMAVSARNGGAGTDWYGMLALGNGGAGWSVGAFNTAGGVHAIQGFSDLNTVKITGGSGVLQVSNTAAWIQSSGTIIQAEANGAATISAGGTTIYGGLNVSGSKNFVMDHPTKPGMELLHGATESPVSGVQYWGCSVIGADGTALVRLPEYFEALVKPGTACIGVNGNGSAVGWDTEVIDNSFTVTGDPGTNFTWDVKAERLGADFDVERQKVVWTPPEAVVE